MRIFNDVCREADQYRNDMNKLKKLWTWVKEHRKLFTESHYGFIKEHIANIEGAYKDEQARIEAKKKLTDNDN